MAISDSLLLLELLDVECSSVSSPSCSASYPSSHFSSKTSKETVLSSHSFELPPLPL